MGLSYRPPECDTNADVGLIAYRKRALVSNFSVLHVNRGSGPDVQDDANYIDGAGLDELFNLVETRKGEAHTCNLVILATRLADGIL